MKRKLFLTLSVIICFLLQSTVFQTLSFASIAPNLMIILTASIGFMRGRKEGLLVGFFGGLLLDIFFGNVLGFYALIYMYVGYINGFFQKIFFPEDIKLPLILIAASDVVCNIMVYFFQFLFRGKFAFSYYLVHVIVPELVYTILVMIFQYFILLKLNQSLESEEKRGAGKFV